MTYWTLNSFFLLPALAVGIWAFVRLRGAARRVTLAAGTCAAVVVLVLTAVFDSVMIAAGLFTYAPELISGVFIGLAPLEDFAYPVAAVLLLPALWILLGARDRGRRKERRP